MFADGKNAVGVEKIRSAERIEKDRLRVGKVRRDERADLAQLAFFKAVPRRSNARACCFQYASVVEAASGDPADGCRPARNRAVSSALAVGSASVGIDTSGNAAATTLPQRHESHPFRTALFPLTLLWGTFVRLPIGQQDTILPHYFFFIVTLTTTCGED